MTAARRPAGDAGEDAGEVEAHAPKSPRVTAPLVVVETKDGRVREMYAGDIVTDDVSAKSLAHLKSIGFIG